MRKMLLISVLYLLTLCSPHPERTWIAAGSSEKPDLEGIHRDKLRANGIRQTMNIARGSSVGRGTTGGARGGAAVIPIYTAAGNRARNHNRGTHHSGGSHGQRRRVGVSVLVTTILIFFFILI